MKIKILTSFIFLITTMVAATGQAESQELVSASPASVGLSATELESATRRLQQHIDEGDIAGVVAAVVRDGKIVYFESLGKMNIERSLPMAANALFRQYSMTREITSAAVLMLWEQRKFKFDEPIKKYLPQFESQRVFTDSANPDMNETKTRVGDITVGQLLTHTSGLGSRSSGIYRANSVRERDITLSKMVDNAARVPLFENPGSRFRYGISTTILGRLVEIWSGQPFEEYLQQQIFSPLKMNDTLFWVDVDKVDRLAVVYRPTDGKLVPHQMEKVPFTEPPTLIEGGVGLVSSTMDFVRFSQMILNRGVLGGERILQAETVDLIFQNAVPENVLPLGSRGYMAGSGWTLGGFNIAMDSATYNHPVAEGTIWWDGSAGTRFWIDPVQNMVIVIMAQSSPARGNGFRENFKTLVDAAIMERR